MNKTLLATSLALAMGASGAAHAAFTMPSAGNYTMTITGGCFAFGDCVTLGTGALTDNISTAQTTFVQATTVGAIAAGTYGSGIANDGKMGIINFTLNGAGAITSVSSYSQDSYLNTSGGTFYLGLGSAGTSLMGGSIGGTGSMTFDPTGRRGVAASFATSLGYQEWNRDNTLNNLGTGLYTPFTTGTSTNRAKGTTAAFSLVGSALADASAGVWTGQLVSAGNIGSNWGGFNNTQYSEVFNVTLSAATAPVPVPAAAWLFGSGLVGLVGVARRKKA